MDGQLAALSREVALLTSSLQREKQRRAAIAEHARDAERRAAAASQRLRQVEYANRRLEERLEAAQTASDERLQVEISAVSDEDRRERARLEADVAALQAQLAAATQAQENLQKERDDAVKKAEEAGAAAAEAEARREAQLKEAAAVAAAGVQPSPGEIGAAVEELQAIVPQYRASIAALQGRVALLSKQLEGAESEAAAAAAEAARWRAAAEANEASFAGAAAKAHAQEAAALVAATAQQEALAAAQADAARWRRRAEEAEAAAAAAATAAQRTQQEVQSQARLATAQAETIVRLEATVREQQEDILAALALVCAPSSGNYGVSSSQTTPTPLQRYRNEIEQQEAAAAAAGVEVGGVPAVLADASIDASLDLLEKRVGSVRKEALERSLPREEEEGEARAVAGVEGEEAWSIPAAAATAQISPEKQRIKAVLSPTKARKEIQSSGRKRGGGSGGAPAMAALASDIAALRDALRQVFKPSKYCVI